jgi:hypothetical protein
MQALGIALHFDLLAGLLIVYVAALVAGAASIGRSIGWNLVTLAAFWAGFIAYALWHMLIDHPRTGVRHHFGELILAVGVSVVLLVAPILARRLQRWWAAKRGGEEDG